MGYAVGYKPAKAVLNKSGFDIGTLLAVERRF